MEFLTTIIENGSIGQFLASIALCVLIIFGLFEYYKLIVYGSTISEKEQKKRDADATAYRKLYKTKGPH